MIEPYETSLQLGFHYFDPHEEDINQLMQKFNILKSPNIVRVEYDLCFSEIQSEAIRSSGMCCFTEPYTDIDVVLADERSSSAWKEFMIIRQNKLMEDAFFWISFIREYLEIKPSILMCVCADGMGKSEHPLLEVFINNLTEKHLFDLKENQTLKVIR